MFRPPARQLLALLAVVSGGLGQPILPSLSYPVFILTPPDVLKTQAGQAFQQTQLHFPAIGQQQPTGQHHFPAVGQQQPASQHHFPTVSDSAFPPPPEPGYEVSQFHSQDELGRVVYGFHGPDQSRMEARSLDGSVRGSYSYVDPNGNIVRMQYWDDGSGFHVTGNALPNGYPQYTPEVAAARAQHLKYYQAALQAAGQIPPGPIMGDGSYGTDHTSDSHHPFDENLPPFDKETNTNNLFNEDSDSVSLDNPELFGNFNYQEEEKKEEDKPSVSGVEGEVELGEDVGPDEDENEESDVNEEQGYEEQQEQNYFRKDKNVKKDNDENKGIKGNTQFKVVVGSDVPKKFFNKEQAHHVNEEEKNKESEDNTDNDDAQHEGDPHGNEEDDHQEEHNEEEEHDDDNHDEHNDDHDEGDDHQNEEEENVEEGVDEHFDTVEHLFNPPDIYSGESYRRSDFTGRLGGTADEEEHYDSGEEHGDAETAENRKSQSSQVNAGTERIVGVQGSPIDQFVDRSRINQFLYQPKRAFFYHYLHTIPKPAERVDLFEDRSGVAASNPVQNLERSIIGGQAALFKSPNQSQNEPSPAIAQEPTIKQPQLDSAQQSSNQIRQASRRLPVTLLQPFTEVHEPQVSPDQSAANPKLYPVYVHEKVR